MSTDEVANAKVAYGVLRAADDEVAEGDIVEARSDYHESIMLLQDWLFALMSSDHAERDRAMERTVPAGIDPVYLATEPWMGLFRTSRRLLDLPTAHQAGEVAVTLFIEIGADSQRASAGIGEVGAFMAEQDDPEMREYGLECVEAADRLRALQPSASRVQ
jgi:hypothetical protein